MKTNTIESKRKEAKSIRLDPECWELVEAKALKERISGLQWVRIQIERLVGYRGPVRHRNAA